MAYQRILFIGAADLYLPSAESLRLRPLVIPALLRLTQAGYALIVSAAAPAHEAGREEAALAWLEDQGLTFLKVLRQLPGLPSLPPHVAQVRPWLSGEALDRNRSAVIGMGADGALFAANLGVQHLKLQAAGESWPQIAAELLEQRRLGTVTRRTNETNISIAVDLDSQGEASQIHTGIGFFDHMLEQLARHGGMQFKIDVQGDLHIDEHHTVEDTALALGQALRQALGDRAGIERYGFLLPMDESLVQVALDLSGRPHLSFNAAFPRPEVGGLPTELVPHFFRSLVEALGATLHVEVKGENAHHMVEGAFKGVARALRQAIKRGGDGGVPSTKGVL